MNIDKKQNNLQITLNSEIPHFKVKQKEDKENEKKRETKPRKK